MPYKEGRLWRAVPKYKGERFNQKKFPTKKEAVKYERDQVRQAKLIDKRLRSGMDLLTFCNRYLDYSTRFAQKTYKEKQALCMRILKSWGPNTLATEINPDKVDSYLLEQAKNRSANASNKDRKNLHAMWVYGMNILGLPMNPVSAIKKLPHTVAPQATYTEDEILNLLIAADRLDGLILRTFLETAGRRKEVFNIAVTDINMERQSVRLWTKKTIDGSPEGEWLPISEKLAGELIWWLQNRPLKESQWLFPNPATGKPYVDPRKWFARLCKRAGGRNLGFHAIRRYVASILDDKHKASRKSIQKLLRHKKESTTERYLYQIHSDLSEMAGKAVPEEKVPRSSTPIKKGASGNNR